MSLVSCSECGQSISTEALACPSCGAQGPAAIRRWSQARDAVKVLALLVAIGAIGFEIYWLATAADREDRALRRQNCEYAYVASGYSPAAAKQQCQ